MLVLWDSYYRVKNGADFNIKAEVGMFSGEKAEECVNLFPNSFTGTLDVFYASHPPDMFAQSLILLWLL